MRLKGKVALVTGAGDGIGRAIALALAKEGADIAVNDLHQNAADGTTALINQFHRKAIPVIADVSQADQVERMVEEALGGFGGIDILVNNAGGLNNFFLLLDYPPEEWDRTIHLNLRSTFLCSRKTAQWMVKQRAGKILNIASITAYGGIPFRSGYGPAKAGIINLTMVMAVELGKYNINVNCIAPSVVLVPRVQRLAEQDLFDVAKVKMETPLGDLCEPDDVAKAAVFLVSDEATRITGVTLPVDGGWLAHRTLA